jgi:hypothetical protein
MGKALGLALAAIITGQAAAHPPQKANIKAVVDGSTFLVRVRGDQVVVANKAMFVAQTMDLRDKMRTAVQQATGCQITDEIWLETKLGGKLNCPD